MLALFADLAPLRQRTPVTAAHPNR
jgi:hypothetical protein